MNENLSEEMENLSRQHKGTKWGLINRRIKNSEIKKFIDGLDNLITMT